MCSMFCCTLLNVHSSFVIILMGKRELVALFNLSSWCLVMVEWLFLVVPWDCMRFVIVVFPDHTHYYSDLEVFSIMNLWEEMTPKGRGHLRHTSLGMVGRVNEGTIKH